MSTSSMFTSRVCAPRTSSYKAGAAWRGGSPQSWWSQHREASLNWLALGLLLAAWNASDDDSEVRARPRPDALRGYPQVSVRAATLHSEGVR